MVVTFGEVDALKALIRCSKDNCIHDGKFDDPLLVRAARYGHVNVVRVLLEACAHVDGSDTLGYTALHYAALGGRLDVCRLLLDWGARMVPSKTKFTPLHYAASRGHFSVVKLLVERGADVGLKNLLRKTASDEARIMGYKDIANWLDTVGSDKV
jgi:ankyrin repeat protein